MLKPSWRDDVVVVMPSLLGMIAALDKGLARPATGGAGSEGNTS
jgi:hypothetical protein